MSLRHHSSPTLELACSSGSVVARVGDRFHAEIEWEIVGFGKDPTYSPGVLGGTPGVFCKPVNCALPSWWRTWAEPDGSVEWYGDSVAAMMLFKTLSLREARQS